MRYCLSICCVVISLNLNIYANFTTLPLELHTLANQQFIKSSYFDVDTNFLDQLHDLIAQDLVFIKIIGGIVVVDGDFEKFKQANHASIQDITIKLQSLADQGLIEDTAMLFYLGGVMTTDIRRQHILTFGEEITKVPTLVGAIDSEMLFKDNYLLFPSPQSFIEKSGKINNYNDKWHDALNAVGVASIISPWEEKKDKVFWQGSSSKCNTEGNNFDVTDISQLCSLMFNPDAHFLLLEELEAPNTLQLFASYQEQLGYKYLLGLESDIQDDNLLWKLYSNSVVLRQDSSYIEWYYSLLVPYIHYVPVKSNLDNLGVQLKWVIAHDEKAKDIALNSTRLAEKYLMPEMIDAYLVYFLKQYTNLVKIIE